MVSSLPQEERLVMVMTFAECVEDDVREAVVALNING